MSGIPSNPVFRSVLTACSIVVGLGLARAALGDALSVNLYHTGATLGPDEWAGVVRVPGWNNVVVPGGFGTSTNRSGFGPAPLTDLAGDPAATLTSSLESYYNGLSGAVGGSDGVLMAEYVSWDPPGDGDGRDDLGNVTVSGLGAAYTGPGYDVYVYADADRNDRTFTVTVNGRSIVGSDFSTFSGEFLRARGAGIDANYFLFEDLTAPQFTIDVASNTGRAAVNAIQVIANGFVPPEEPPPPPPPRPGDGPNIVVFVVDDMGWQDTSVPFHSSPTVWNDLYRTPSMERLASRGMVFTNAYAASPVCSPTRVCLMTGKNPARTGVTDWVGHGTSTNFLLESAVWRSAGLQPGDGNTTLPSLLRDAGYRTAHVGKAHFGQGSGADPTRLGFDINIGGSQVGSPRGSGSRGRYFAPFGGIHPNLGQYRSNTHMNTALTAEAVAIIENAHAEGFPLFLHLAHYAVHTPLGGQGDPPFLPAYANRPNPEDDYAALLESMDASLGRVLDTLDELGIADDTLVVFVSDNGGLANHARAITANRDDPWARDRHNAPLRSGKGAAYEGGIRVPMIVAWAGQPPRGEPVNPTLPIAPGSSSDVPVHVQDLFPTLLSVAGIEDADRHLALVDGRDLTPILDGSNAFERDRPLVWHYPHQWRGDVGVGPGIEPFTAIRRGDMKALYFYVDQRWELYDLASDIGEENDLAADDPRTVNELGNELIAWMAEVGARLPRVRRPVRLTVEGTVYRDGEVVEPAATELTLASGEEMPVIVPRAAAGPLQIPGDCNQDGVLDLSDGLCLLGNMFRGRPARLPCGDGTSEDRGNVSLLDSNGDGGIDVSDAVSVFGFLFLGQPAPVLGTRCVPIAGCADNEACE